MARYRKVDVRMWTDERFRRLSSPPPNGQSLFQYLITGRETSSIPGLFEAREVALADRLNWPLEGLREAFREVFREGMAEADWSAGLIWVPNAIKYNRPESPNVVRSWSVVWDELPECELKTKAYQHLLGFMEGLSKGFREAFAEACGKPLWKAMANQEQEQEQEGDRAPAREIPPWELIIEVWCKVGQEATGDPIVVDPSTLETHATKLHRMCSDVAPEKPLDVAETVFTRYWEFKRAKGENPKMRFMVEDFSDHLRGKAAGPKLDRDQVETELVRLEYVKRAAESDLEGCRIHQDEDGMKRAVNNVAACQKEIAELRAR